MPEGDKNIVLHENLFSDWMSLGHKVLLIRRQCLFTQSTLNLEIEVNLEAI